MVGGSMIGHARYCRARARASIKPSMACVA
jgi:hypothetical protein